MQQFTYIHPSIMLIISPMLFLQKKHRKSKNIENPTIVVQIEIT
jgi:hypothetical protein